MKLIPLLKGFLFLRISSFSLFTVATDASVLPVELFCFYGRKKESDVQLYWQTASEISEGDLAQFFNVNGLLLDAFQTSETSTQYSVSHFPKGAYFIKIGNTVKRIVIQ